MVLQRTLAIIKPDAVAAGNTGNIIEIIEKSGFRIVAMKMIQLTTEQAKGFYAVHAEKPFFSELVNFMIEGPVVPMILEADGAILKWRNVMGATNPENADPGTIRKTYGASLQSNAVHGSDAEDTASFETRYFFNAMETL